MIFFTSQASNRNNIMAYILMNSVALNILNGIDFYKKNNKAQAMMMFIAGLFVIIVVITYFL